jgi:hypothetical protein
VNALAAAVLLLALFVGGADPTLSVGEDEMEAGEPTEVAVSGFAADDGVEIWLEGRPVAEMTTDDSGAGTGVVAVADEALPGDVDVVAVGADADGTRRSVTVIVPVVAADRWTEAERDPSAALALGLTTLGVVGVTAMVLIRQRRSTDATAET